MTKIKSHAIQTDTPEWLRDSSREWYAALKKLDERTVSGISPTSVKAPDGKYYEARSDEDAYFIGIGRKDLR